MDRYCADGFFDAADEWSGCRYPIPILLRADELLFTTMSQKSSCIEVYEDR